ncbi:MAG TPA: hypothetical protein PK597_00215 [Oscillospiraceae bacterium]|nr:hypothetical protein [Oscillospiraceae bacterium]
MADYKEMYLDLLSASERAIRILTEAQRLAEERYLASEETPLVMRPSQEDAAGGK